MRPYTETIIAKLQHKIVGWKQCLSRVDAFLEQEAAAREKAAAGIAFEVRGKRFNPSLGFCSWLHHNGDAHNTGARLLRKFCGEKGLDTVFPVVHPTLFASEAFRSCTPEQMWGAGEYAEARWQFIKDFKAWLEESIAAYESRLSEIETKWQEYIEKRACKVRGLDV